MPNIFVFFFIFILSLRVDMRMTMAHLNVPKASFTSHGAPDENSALISLLRFPMMVMVVLLHCAFDEVLVDGVRVGSERYAGYAFYRLFITEIANASVALFFIISGYLFFKGGFRLTIHTYFQKCRRRVYTLLIPYLLWCIVYIGAYYLAQRLMPGSMEGVMKDIASFSFRDWLSCLWDVQDLSRRSGPIVPQFWFIRELMIVVLLVPLIAFGVYWLGTWFLALLLVMYVLPVPSATLVALLFFSIGAYWGIRNTHFSSLSYAARWAALLLFVGLTIYVIIVPVHYVDMLYQIAAFSGAMAFLGWGTWLLRRYTIHVPTLLVDSSFFLFAYHQLPARLVSKWAMPYLPEAGLSYAIAQLLICVLLSVIGVWAYGTLRRLFPGVIKLFCGGR